MMEIIETILSLSQGLGYWGIIALMAVESSFIPFPSEIVVPPAAYLASQGEFNLFLVIIAGLVGSLIGALVNYFLALYLGRLIIYKIADHKFFNLLLLNSGKIKKAEDFFLKYGRASTFFGRLVPVVRQLISLPAGFVKMNLKIFTLYTALGAGIWVTILALLGYYFGANQELFSKYYQEISLAFIAIVVLFIAFKIIKKKK